VLHLIRLSLAKLRNISIEHASLLHQIKNYNRKMFYCVDSCGLFYKHIMIVIDDSKVMPQFGVSLLSHHL